MVQCLERQFASASLSRCRSKRAFTVHNCCDDTIIIPPQPRSSGKTIETRKHMRPVGPMARRRFPGPRMHLIAVGADYDGPLMVGTT